MYRWKAEKQSPNFCPGRVFLVGLLAIRFAALETSLNEKISLLGFEKVVCTEKFTTSRLAS